MGQYTTSPYPFSPALSIIKQLLRQQKACKSGERCTRHSFGLLTNPFAQTGANGGAYHGHHKGLHCNVDDSQDNRHVQQAERESHCQFIETDRYGQQKKLPGSFGIEFALAFSEGLPQRVYADGEQGGDGDIGRNISGHPGNPLACDEANEGHDALGKRERQREANPLATSQTR